MARVCDLVRYVAIQCDTRKNPSRTGLGPARGSASAARARRSSRRAGAPKSLNILLLARMRCPTPPKRPRDRETERPRDRETVGPRCQARYRCVPPVTAPRVTPPSHTHSSALTTLQ
eukprot:1867005-Prymnesium_polylepis.1